MLMQREELGDRLRRRMTEKKAAKMAAAKKRPRRHEPSAKEFAILDIKDIKNEIAAIDRRAAEIRRQLGEQPSPGQVFGVDVRGYRDQELRAELGPLLTLKREVQNDLEHPITSGRDGKPLTVRERTFRRMRTQELREQLSWQAERAEAESDFRRSRQLRHDALAARRIVEWEMKLRPSLRGYSFPG